VNTIRAALSRVKRTYGQYGNLVALSYRSIGLEHLEEPPGAVVANAMVPLHILGPVRRPFARLKECSYEDAPDGYADVNDLFPQFGDALDWRGNRRLDPVECLTQVDGGRTRGEKVCSQVGDMLTQCRDVGVARRSRHRLLSSDRAHFGADGEQLERDAERSERRDSGRPADLGVL
jgi:hypothetical protein